MDKDFHIKLADFGSISPNPKMQKKKEGFGNNSVGNGSKNSNCKFLGSGPYISPEIYQGLPSDEKNDMFALGVC